MKVENTTQPQTPATEGLPPESSSTATRQTPGAGQEKLFQPIALKYPLTTLNGVVRTITLRRGQMRDLAIAKRNAEGDDEAVDAWLVAILAQEKLQLEDVQSLDLADWIDVKECLKRLLV